MATITGIRTGIKSALANISALVTYDFLPDNIEVPCALVAPIETIEYDIAMSRGADKYEFPIYLYVSRVDAELSQDEVDTYLAPTGANSIKTAIETDTSLGGECQSVRVTDASEFGVYNIGGIDYIGVLFTVEVIA